MPSASELERINQEEFEEVSDAPGFREELQNLINSHSMENGSDTPDFILADFLQEQLQLFDRAIGAREKWYGRTDRWSENG